MVQLEGKLASALSEIVAVQGKANAAEEEGLMLRARVAELEAQLEASSSYKSSSTVTTSFQSSASSSSSAAAASVLKQDDNRQSSTPFIDRLSRKQSEAVGRKAQLGGITSTIVQV